MKNTLIFIVSTLLFVSTIFLPTTFAQNYTQLNLPEGATARLGKGYIRDAQYSPDGTLLAVASSIGIWIYEAQTGEELNLFMGSVRSVLFSPDSSTIASGNGNGTISIWDVETGIVIHRLLGDRFEFSPDGSTIASWGDDDTIHIWDTETGAVIHRLSALTDVGGINRVAFSPDGSTIASWGDDDTIHIWNAETGVIIQTFSADIVFSGSHSYVMLSPDGSTFVSWDDYDTYQIWDAETGDIIRTLGHEIQYNVMFSPDGRLLAVGSSDPFTISIWDAETGAVIHTFLGTDFELSPDGSTIATWHVEDQFGGEGIPISIIDIETGVVIQTLSGHEFSVDRGVAFSPDGTKIASGNGDGTISIGDVEAGAVIHTLSGDEISVDSVAFSRDGTKIASRSRSENNTVRLWDVETGENIYTFTGHTGEVGSVSFSPDGTKIASGSKDSTIRLWDVSTGENITTLEHTGEVGSMSFSPDGTKIASGSKDSTVRLWDVKTSENIRTLEHTGEVRSLSFSPDGTTLASGSDDGTVLLWDIAPAPLINFRLENGKSVTIYRESEDTLVYTFGVPGKKPELEYKGPIIAKVSAQGVLWSDGIENLKDLRRTLSEGNSSWTMAADEEGTIEKKIAIIATSRESRGFIRVDAGTGLVSESVYIFRTGGWEYIIGATWGRPINVSEDELEDYNSYSLTVISPTGKKYQLR